jgi:hypothetical protein
LRNVRCPHYGECLDRAARANAAGFDCDGCARIREAAEINPHEARSCAVLLAVLFVPELHRLYLEEVRKSENDPRGGDEVEGSIPGAWDTIDPGEIA